VGEGSHRALDAWLGPLLKEAPEEVRVVVAGTASRPALVTQPVVGISYEASAVERILEQSGLRPFASRTWKLHPDTEKTYRSAARRYLMIRSRFFAGLGPAIASLVLASCGGGSSPSQQTAVPTPVPTPTPAPTPPPKALSVIPACALPASRPANPDCQKPTARIGPAVDAAIDRTMAERPELFDFKDVNGGPRILDYGAYMTAVVAAIGEAGLCGKVDAEGEIGVKTSNSFNEQWIIASRAGWNPPSGNWVIRKYVGACSPSTF
jgi:hypothetical protein